jgi:NADH-ubiquinone oxidoreductase chain 5
MFLACGFSYYSVALFHLFNHAFFKALLFLSAGAIIHALNDEQDMRKMGGLLAFLPFTFVCMLFGSLAIMGFPFLTGFYSKDLILELLLSSYLIDSLFFYNLALAAAFLTAFYSTRLIIYVFLLPANFSRNIQPHEPHMPMTIAMFLLVIGSLFFGFIFSDLFIGLGRPLNSNIILNITLLSPFERNLPLILSLLAAIISLPLLNIKFINPMAPFFYHAGHFNTIYNKIFIKIFLFSYNINTKLIDKGLLEA